MRNFRRGPAVLVAALIALVVVIVAVASGGSEKGDKTAAGGSSAGSGGAGKTDTLVVAIPATPPRIDLGVTVGPQTWLVGGQVVERGMGFARAKYTGGGGLADPNKVPGFTVPNYDLSTIEPGIIERCALNASGKVATFHLRKGVMSGYGNEFTSADVLWGVERALGLKALTAFFLQLEGADHRDQWKAVDKYTVRITGKAAMPLICKLQTHLHAGIHWDSVEAKKHATPDDPWATKWIGTHAPSFGPYVVREFQSGRQVVLAANDKYWRGAPRIKNIIFQVVPDSSARLALLERGKVDIAESLSADDLSSFSGKPGIRPVGWRSPLMTFLVMNNKKPPFNDVRVRRAINIAIPRDTIAKDIYRGLAAPFQGPTPSIFGEASGYTEHTDYAYDLDKAKKLLADAGVTKANVELSYNADDPVQQRLAVLLKDTLSRIGIAVDLQQLPAPSIQDLVFANKADFAIWADAAFFPDPQFVTQVFYYHNVSNYSNYTNNKLFDAIDAGKTILDPAKRIEYFRKLQETIHNDAPFGWMVEPNVVVGVRDRVRGLAPDLFPWYEVWRMGLSA